MTTRDDDQGRCGSRLEQRAGGAHGQTPEVFELLANGCVRTLNQQETGVRAAEDWTPGR